MGDFTEQLILLENGTDSVGKEQDLFAVIQEQAGDPIVHDPSGTIVVGSGTVGSKFLRTSYPHIKGTTAGTTLQNDNPNL